ncbi:tryptophan synthetase [Ascosphaera pollenicola]|nr:tryptophan synthetase [Ascosphaera pollenicola]
MDPPSNIKRRSLSNHELGDATMLVPASGTHRLYLLDQEITNSKNLRRVLPLRVIAIDGYVSLTSLDNCSTTSRLTYILDPIIVPQWKIQEKLRRATEAVADHLGYDRSWMSCHPAGHISARLIRAIWMESIDQNVIIWAGRNITVYAPLWEWMLDEKMKLIAGAFPYVERQDLTDAVDILRKVNLKYKKVTSANQLIHRHRRIQPPVRMGMYRILNQFYEQKYQKAGLVFDNC